MSTERDVNRIVRSWLEEGVSALPDRVLDGVLDQLPTTSQRRAWWPAWRLSEMNNALKLAIAAVAVVVVAIVGFNLLPKSGGVGGPSPTLAPTPTPTPTEAPTPSGSPAVRNGPLPAGTYIIGPAPKDRFWSCPEPLTPACSNTIGLVVTVPDGWTGVGNESIWLRENAPPDGAAVLFTRGADLYVDPCSIDSSIPVGPTAADFATALANHPLLDVTAPVDVSLAGYSGRYVDLQVPSDISACPFYRPWEPGLYAQGPSQRWHLWILDVGGQRVVVQSTDYAGTSAEDRSALQAIVDSIQILP